MAGRGQVEDRQPPVAERHGRVDEHAGVVRAAVAERVGHRRDEQLAALESRGQVDRAGDWATDAARSGAHSLKIAASGGGLTRWLSNSWQLPAQAGKTYAASHG